MTDPTATDSSAATASSSAPAGSAALAARTPERDAILGAAGVYHRQFRPDHLTAAPTRHVTVISCMDARLDLFRLLGLQIGDSHILRNAGGRVTDDTIRSLVLSAHWLGTREYVVIHHTGCGLLGVTNNDIRTRVETATGHDPGIDFLPIADLEQSVADDVEAIRACPLLPSDAVVWGAVYDVHTGELIPVGTMVGMRR